jgi:hypothetical protein
MLLAIDLYEYFVNAEGIAIAAVSPFQSASIDSTELDAPEADRLPSNNDAALSQEILDIAVAEIESVVEPESLPHEVLWVQHRK